MPHNLAARHLWSLSVALLLAVACQDGTNGNAALATFSASPTRATSSRSEGLCDRLPLIEMIRAVGANAELEPDASGPTVCTYRIETGTDQAYHIAIRLEDSFQSLGEIDTAFPDGVEVHNVGDGGFWAPVVATLWVSQRDLLYAVQVVGLEGDETARNIATAVAEAVLRHL